MSLEVNRLLKQYGDQKAVNQISFSVRKGEIVGFLGPNGAGKSTTMKMIAGYLKPDEGTVSVCGMDVQQYPLAIKSKIGYLPESNPLYTDMYIKEYLQFVSALHAVKSRSAINDTIALVGLQAEQHKKIGQLSKGYRQRVGLAAALIHHPEILILDEPTSGLDPNQIIEIRNVISQQGKDKTVLFSSHILQEVEAICDRVIIINQGKIVADDSLTGLRNSGQSNKVVIVEFDTEIDQQWLQTLQFVDKVTETHPMQFSLQNSNPEQVRKQLLGLSLQHNLNIVSLQTENHSLEEVFRKLTAGQ